MSIPSTQTAVQINGYGGLEVVEVNDGVPVPEVGENQLLVKNEFAGVNFIDTVHYPKPSLNAALTRR